MDGVKLGDGYCMVEWMRIQAKAGAESGGYSDVNVISSSHCQKSLSCARSGDLATGQKSL